MNQLPESERRRFEMQGVGEAWLAHPVRYARESRVAAEELEPGEVARAVFPVMIGRSLWGGALFVTDRRLLYVRARKWVKPVVRSVPFSEIRAIKSDDLPVFPGVEIVLKDGNAIVLSGTLETRTRVPEIIQYLRSATDAARGAY